MTLEQKIIDSLNHYIRELGFCGCWEFIPDAEIMDKHEVALSVCDALARLLDYPNIYQYIEKNSHARKIYYQQLKSGIEAFKRSHEMFADDIEVDIALTEEEIEEIKNLIES